MIGTVHSLITEHETDGARTIGRANNPAAGIVSVQVPPGRPRLFELGQELLIALGKNPGVSGTGKHQIEDWQLLPAWLVAQRIRHVVLTDAQWLAPAHLDELCGLAAVCGVQLCLVAHQPVNQRYIDALARWPVTDSAPSDLVAIVADGLRRPTEPATRAFPRVPTDNFPTFRAAARRHLDPEDFAAVDARLVAAYDQAAAFLAEHTPSVEGLYRLLRRELHRCVSADEMLVVVRGVQVAAFRAGWLVNADLTQLIVTADHASAAAIHAPQIWQRLAAYREPYRGAACALAAAELSIDEMLGPSCADVDPEGTAVTVRRGGKTDRVGVPAGAEVYLRAQLAWCAIQGALAHEPLFAKKEEPMRSRFISYALRAPIVELGIPLLSQRAEKVRTDHARWAKRFGLSAQELR